MSGRRHMRIQDQGDMLAGEKNRQPNLKKKMENLHYQGVSITLSIPFLYKL